MASAPRQPRGARDGEATDPKDASHPLDAAAICAHMNADHADALVLYCRHFADVTAETAEMIGIDGTGFQIRAHTADGTRDVRIAFPVEVRTGNDARRALIALLQEARGGGRT